MRYFFFGEYIWSLRVIRQKKVVYQQGLKDSIKGDHDPPDYKSIRILLLVWKWEKLYSSLYLQGLKASAKWLDDDERTYGKEVVKSTKHNKHQRNRASTLTEIIQMIPNRRKVLCTGRPPNEC